MDQWHRFRGHGKAARLKQTAQPDKPIESYTDSTVHWWATVLNHMRELHNVHQTSQPQRQAEVIRHIHALAEHVPHVQLLPLNTRSQAKWRRALRHISQ